MLERARQWLTRKRAELAVRKYPRVRKYIYSEISKEQVSNFPKLIDKHGNWLEQTFKALEDSGKDDAVMKFAHIIRGYAQTNPELIGRLRAVIPQDNAMLARILAQTEMKKDPREMVGQIVLYSQIPEEARRAEIRKLLDVLDQDEQHRLWVKIHNHAMLRVPRAALRAVFDEVVQKRPELKDTIQNILGE